MIKSFEIFFYIYKRLDLYMYNVSGLVFTTRRNSLFNFLLNRCKEAVVVVAFVQLYILADFYICFPLQCFLLNSIYNFRVSKISHLSFSIFMYHIFYIFHRLERFSGSFLPISFQFSSLPIGHHIFPICGQLLHSYFFCQMSHSQFSSFLDCFSAFSQFGATYFTHVM